MKSYLKCLTSTLSLIVVVLLVVGCMLEATVQKKAHFTGPSPDKIYSATVKTLALQGMQILSSDKDSMVITFRAKDNWLAANHAVEGTIVIESSTPATTNSTEITTMVINGVISGQLLDLGAIKDTATAIFNDVAKSTKAKYVLIEE